MHIGFGPGMARRPSAPTMRPLMTTLMSQNMPASLPVR